MPEFRALTALFKRVKNITKGLDDSGVELSTVRTALVEPSELALVDQMIERWGQIDSAFGKRDLLGAMRELAHLTKPVDRFFTEVLVMAEDLRVREARLALLTRLRSAVLKNFGDISELAADEERQA